MINNKRIISIFLAAVMLFSVIRFPISAAAPETVVPMASDYISSYSASISRNTGSKTFSVNYTIAGTGTMDLIGARMIIVYQSEDGEDWSIQSIFRYDDNPELMIKNKAVYATSKLDTGSYGCYYKAMVIFRCERNGGYDERGYYTEPIYVSLFTSNP